MPAGADSIAYVKDGDVWLATPDGARQKQVTRTGIYSYVSQADTGEMVALASGERLHKLSRTGKVLPSPTRSSTRGSSTRRATASTIVELSRDLQTAVGIAGQDSEKLRVYRTLMHPFGAPSRGHTPFKQGNRPVAQPCFELGDPVGGKFESTSLAPDGSGLAYGVGDGIWVAPLDCAAPSAGRLAIPGGRFPDWGPVAFRPASGGKVQRGSKRVSLRR